jgi:hypothetical protein
MTECPQCGEQYRRLGQHFAIGRCDRPELTDHQKGVIEYLVLRGANVRSDDADPRLAVFSTEQTRLELVAESLGWLANEPRCHVKATDPNSRDMYAFTTVPHPSLNYDGPADVDQLRPLTASLIVTERGTFVGSLFGSLQIDLRGFDVSGQYVRTLLARENVATVEYGGEGYATDTHTARYHYHDDVVVVPHYDALDLLDWIDLSLNDIAEPLKPRD